jgi:suppressor for copper-sensitivity B
MCHNPVPQADGGRLAEKASLRMFRLGGAVLAAALALGGAPGAKAAATPWVGDAHAAARLITAADAVGAGAMVEAGLEIRLGPGWHAYWRSPGDAGIPPRIDFADSANLAHAAVTWPAPTRFSLQGLETAGYENHVVLPIALKLQQADRRLDLRAAVDYAACAQFCVPYSAKFDLALPVGEAGAAPQARLIAAARRLVPQSLSEAGFALVSASAESAEYDALLTLRLRGAARFRSPDLFVEGLAQGSPGRPAVTLGDDGRQARLSMPLRGTPAASVIGNAVTLTLVDGTRAAEFTAAPIAGTAGRAVRLLSVLAVALLGGLILNVMPCVLPVVSLKLLAVAGQAGRDRRRARLGVVMTALGVLGSFATFAVALIGLKLAGAAIGWGIQFQWPWFVALMAAVTTLFAASLWGSLPIALPRPVYDAAGAVRSGRPHAEAFLTGVFATLLTTPCSAPFVGTAIGFALAQGPFEIALVFAFMGLGLAAPYLLVAAAPPLVALLPRPGRWMGAVRAVLGMTLAGTAVWLLFVLSVLSGPEAALGTGAALAALLMLLWLKTRRRLSALAARFASGSAAVIVGAAVLWPAFAGTEQTPWPATGRWQRFDPAAVERLVGDGKVVFVDVSAAWCLTCKLNETAVLDRALVADRLFAPGVVAMRGDWTRPDPALTRYLEGFGRYGIPFDAVYGPGRPRGETLPELLTANAVLQALDRAGGDAEAADAAPPARP